MIPPTTAQQRGLAYAPLPFASLSLLSSLGIICYLTCTRERRRLRRLYHRLVLAMNVSLLLVSFSWIWGPFAVPEGTEYYAGASGTVQTCTASAFIWSMFSLTVPTYYVSLSLQGLMGVRNNFKEEKYRWIEKYIHLVAVGIPLALTSIVAATENFNPSGSGCYVAKYPRDCENDPAVECERGQDIWFLELIVGLGLVCLYFVFPPAMIMGMYCWIRKAQMRVNRTRGMQRIRESARKQMMHNIALQVSVYLLSFWFTWVWGLIHQAYLTLTNRILYDFLIFANCVQASQGIVFAAVYFALQRLGQPHKIDVVECSASARQGLRRELTVSDIRSNAEHKARCSGLEAGATRIRRESYTFNIFDGVPDPDSPWAQFIPDDDDSRETPDHIDAELGQRPKIDIVDRSNVSDVSGRQGELTVEEIRSTLVNIGGSENKAKGSGLEATLEKGEDYAHDDYAGAAPEHDRPEIDAAKHNASTRSGPRWELTVEEIRSSYPKAATESITSSENSRRSGPENKAQSSQGVQQDMFIVERCA